MPALRKTALGCGVVALLAVHGVLAYSAALTKSPAYDEGIHVTAGYCQWRLGDYRLTCQSGCLPERLAALPLLGGDWGLPPTDQPDWRKSKEWIVSDRFLHGCGNDVQAMFRRARLGMVGLSMLLGLAVFAWSRRLFGLAGGFISLTLYAFEPSMLANAPLTTADVAAATFFTLSLLGFSRLLERLTPLRLACSCLAMGLLFVAKMSAGMVVLMVLLLVGLHLLRGKRLTLAFGRPRQISGRGAQAAILLGVLALHALAGWLVIWSFYGFRYSAFADASPDNQLQLTWPAVAPKGGLMGAGIGAARRAHLLPEAYLYGFCDTMTRSAGRRAFLNGEHSDTGWWHFFPYSFLVKTPLASLGLLALAAGAGVAANRRRFRASWEGLQRQQGDEQQGQAEHPMAHPAGPHAGEPAMPRGLAQAAPRPEPDSSPLWILIGVYGLAAMLSRMNIGHRHILPIYPAVFVLAGAAAYWLRRWRWLGVSAVGACLLLLAADSLRSWPNYLAYFNRLAGGPANGYRHLVDASLDWGQDLPALKRLLASLPPGERVYLSYFGIASPDYYGISAERLFCMPGLRSRRRLLPLQAGTYCISATVLQAVAGPWTASREVAYQKFRAQLEAQVGRQSATVPGEAELKSPVEVYDFLRLARLAAYCRSRPCDGQVNYSILIYRLNAAEVAAALEGPPAELK